ncbi:hypothetical protein [Streptomyces sp. NBC_00690]|uniref:hypothetical protein n=1 Tax=Streptomyces sp. NBC_00690 TaxID=2975808 RepID=UPI002E2868A9|nr:hypothetical protein [Streptomyces sp. NBC_00690]
MTDHNTRPVHDVGPTPGEVSAAVSALTGYAVRYAVITLGCETALDQVRTAHGQISDPCAAEAALAERTRDLAAIATTWLLPHTQTLTAAARQGIDRMPPARHHTGWRLLLNDLDHAAAQLRAILNTHPDPADQGGRDAQLWPFLRTWSEQATLLRDLTAQAQRPHVPLPTLGAEEDLWTGRARTARSRGLLDPIESWYEAGGQLITLVYLPPTTDTAGEDEEDIVVALAGDIDSPTMRAIGHYTRHEDALAELPPQVPPGVLRPTQPDARAVPDPALPFLGALTREVIDAQHSASVAKAISYLTDRPPHPAGHLAQLTPFLNTCAAWATAMDTRAGQTMATRLRILTTQVDHLTSELISIQEDMGNAVAVLPPHRTPAPRHLPPTPPPRTALPPTVPIAPAAVQHR